MVIVMRILVVDGSERVRKSLIRFLELENKYETVFEAETVKDAKRIMQSIMIEVLLLDIQLNDNSGVELINFCNSQLHKPVVIVCSNYSLPQYINIYETLSVNKFFDKSSELPEMKKFIKGITAQNKDDMRRYRNTINFVH